MSTPLAPGPAPPAAASPRRSVRSWRTTRRPSFMAYGHPLLFVTGGALALCLVMILGLLAVVFAQGLETFWPRPLVLVRTAGGKTYLGDVIRTDEYRPEPSAFAALPEEKREAAAAAVAADGGVTRRRLLRTGNHELTGTRSTPVSDFEVAEESHPEWAAQVERFTNEGVFNGTPTAFVADGQVTATEPAAVWAEFEKHHPAALEVGRKRARLRQRIGELDAEAGALRKTLAKAGAADVTRLREDIAGREQKKAEARQELTALGVEAERYRLTLATADGKEKSLPLGDVVRAYTPNRMGLLEKVGLYLARWWEFLSADPRNANTEGGVFPAIFGTFVMTILMAVAVVPFGVLAALYLREYAKAGVVVSVLRIAINNLAGVPSIVFGVFGLGFFCLLLGGGIDAVFFPEYAASGAPVMKTGTVLWASLTLALLTLPVVIVATEESLAAVPRSMREGSYACGASKWQTIRRIVLPRALPGILTGMILAMARGAGEVAPLMMVGLLKTAKALPLDLEFPFFHPERSFMHLGFQIYDVGFQSTDSEAARPMVFTTTLLLIVLVALLNVAAMWLRARLRRRFLANQF